MIKQAWDYKSEVANNNKQSLLSKGKKFLSEYYYIDLEKIALNMDENTIAALNFMVIASGHSLGDFQGFDKSIYDYYEMGIQETETGNVVVKMKTEDGTFYTHDFMGLGSGYFRSNLAIRKYVLTIDSFTGDSGAALGVTSFPLRNVYIDAITAAARMLLLMQEGSGFTDDFVANVKLIEKQLIELIQPYLISEEEFWDDIQLVDSADELQDLMPNT